MSNYGDKGYSFIDYGEIIDQINSYQILLESALTLVNGTTVLIMDEAKRNESIDVLIHLYLTKIRELMVSYQELTDSRHQNNPKT